MLEVTSKPRALCYHFEYTNLSQSLDSLAAFFQYLFQFLHGSGSQHGDSRLTKIGNALEDRGGGKVATGVENASVLVDALHVDAKLLLQEVNLLIYG